MLRRGVVGGVAAGASFGVGLGDLAGAVIGVRLPVGVGWFEFTLFVLEKHSFSGKFKFKLGLGLLVGDGLGSGVPSGVVAPSCCWILLLCLLCLFLCFCSILVLVFNM